MSYVMILFECGNCYSSVSIVTKLLADGGKGICLVSAASRLAVAHPSAYLKGTAGCVQVQSHWDLKPTI